MPRLKTADMFPFQVIAGGLAASCPSRPTTPRPVTMGASETAAEMSRLYALSLLASLPTASLRDPHQQVRIDHNTSFSVHDLLCELRNLPWFDAQGVPSDCAPCPTFSSPVVPEKQRHRRFLNWNGDGQLTLRSLFPHASQWNGFGTPSAAWRAPRDLIDAAQDQVRDAWLAKAAAISGTADGTLGHTAASMQDDGTLARFGHALACILGDMTVTLPWSKSETLTLFRGLIALSEQNAQRKTALTRVGGLGRPTVTASHLSILASYSDDPFNAAGEMLVAALDEIETHAPRLLHWVHARNRGACADGFGGAADLPMRLDRNLLMPRLVVDGVPVHPSRLAGRTFVAGAAATFLKALLPAGDARSDALDGLAQRAAIGAQVAGAAYHAETAADMRRGEALGRDVLRAMLAGTGRTVQLTDFDGRALVLSPVRNGDRHAAYLDGHAVHTSPDQPALYAVI